MKRTETRETHHCDICNDQLPAEYAEDGEHYRLTRYEQYDHPHSGGSRSSAETIELCSRCGKLAVDFVKSPIKSVHEIAGLKFLVLK